MKQITDAIRMLMVLADSDGMTVREIADATGVAAETVSTRISWYAQNKQVERLNPGHRPLRFAVTALGRSIVDDDWPDEEEPKEPVVIAEVLARRPALDLAWMSIAREQEASHV